MVTTSALDPAADAAHLARERHLRACLRVLEGPRWQQRLEPLAELLAQLRLVRRPGPEGAPLRRISAEPLRQAFCRLLQQGDDDGGLLFDVVVDAMDPAWVAQEHGLTEYALGGRLRQALGALARMYEQAAYSGTVSEPGLAGAMRTRMGGKR